MRCHFFLSYSLTRGHFLSQQSSNSLWGQSGTQVPRGGRPVNFSAIHNIYGIKLSGQVKNTVNEYTTETHLSMQDVEEGDYVCSVETHYRGTLVDSVKKTLSVQLYST